MRQNVSNAYANMQLFYGIPDGDFDGDVDEAGLSVTRDGDDITGLELINLAEGLDLKYNQLR